ncbi:hypothetical protein BU15DRAFT_57928 [Melanogaster broomeanus]|nr:hypothetical protein BU15DRAFT_57928 [Melanogaster broomeanus]
MDLSDVESQWKAVHLTKMFQVLTFDREVVLVWNRYLGGATLIPEKCQFRSLYQGVRKFQHVRHFLLSILSRSTYIIPVGDNYIIFQAWMTAFSLWTIQVSMPRVKSLSQRKDYLLVLYVRPRKNDAAVPGPMCSLADISRYFYTFTIPVLPFECLLVAVTLSGGLRHVAEMRTAISDWTPSSTMIIPMKDAFIHFVVTCTGYSMAGVIWLHNPPLFEIPLSVVLVANVIIGSRMFLNLRQVTSQYNPEDLPEMIVSNDYGSHLSFASQRGEAVEMDNLPPDLCVARLS